MSLFASKDGTRWPSFVLPAEFEKQEGIIMAWPTADSIEEPAEGWAYPEANVDANRQELAEIAKTIAKFEPVHMFVRDPRGSDKKDQSGYRSAHKTLARVENLRLHVTSNVDSLWARDTGPVFVKTRHGEVVENKWHANDNPGVGFKRIDTATSKVGLLLGFHQWGRKLETGPDAFFAAATCQSLEVSAVLAPFVGEGGGIEVDGEGTMIATESCLINPNRNPGLSKGMLEAYFAQFLGVEKVIWLSGTRGEDITDGHVDGLARFASPGVVMLSRPSVSSNSGSQNKDLQIYEEAKVILETATDAKGREIRVVPVQEPNPKISLGRDYSPESGPCLSYVNFLIMNGVVLLPRFGDKEADEEALRVITKEFHDREICLVYLHQLAIQGGGVHCATKQF